MRVAARPPSLPSYLRNDDRDSRTTTQGSGSSPLLSGRPGNPCCWPSNRGAGRHRDRLLADQQPAFQHGQVGDFDIIRFPVRAHQHCDPVSRKLRPPLPGLADGGDRVKNTFLAAFFGIILGLGHGCCGWCVPSLGKLARGPDSQLSMSSCSGTFRR